MTEHGSAFATEQTDALRLTVNDAVKSRTAVRTTFFHIK